MLNLSTPTTEAYSIVEFCRLHSVSRSLFYRMLKQGIAPHIIKIGRRTLITREAATAWRASMETMPPLTNNQEK